GKKVVIAEGLWIKCDSCKEIVYRAEVERAGRVCPKCRYAFRITAHERLAQLIDHGTFEERDGAVVPADPLGFKDTKRYRDRVRAAREKTGTTEAVVTGVGRVGGFSVVVAAFEFAYLGGSMGSAVGGKIAETIRQPLPDGFQRSEFLLEHGQLDLIVERGQLRDTLRRLLSFFADQPTSSG